MVSHGLVVYVLPRLVIYTANGTPPQGLPRALQVGMHSTIGQGAQLLQSILWVSLWAKGYLVTLLELAQDSCRRSPSAYLR